MSSLLVPTNIAELEVYPDISPQRIQPNNPPSEPIRRAVDTTPASKESEEGLPYFFPTYFSGACSKVRLHICAQK